MNQEKSAPEKWQKDYDEQFSDRFMEIARAADKRLDKQYGYGLASLETDIELFIASEKKESYQAGLHDLIHAHQIFKEELKVAREKIKKDLLEIADQGEFEDLRREVERYFE